MPTIPWGVAVRSFIISMFLLAALVAGLAGGWVAMNYYNPGTVGTPAHAGVVTNGRPEDCTNVNFVVNPREVAERAVYFDKGVIVRGTFEANGGFGRVNLLLRVRSPQNDDILASPKAENYDFYFPVRSHGEYRFIFDNRYSMFTSKAVGFFYCVDRGA